MYRVHVHNVYTAYCMVCQVSEKPHNLYKFVTFSFMEKEKLREVASAEFRPSNQVSSSV